MNKCKIMLIMIVLCTMTNVCWGQSYWKKTYSGPLYGISTQMLSQPDGSVLILGSTDFNEADSGNILLLKINSAGDTLWTKTYGGKHCEYPTQMLIQPDGSVLILGIIYTATAIVGTHDTWLLKINSSGDLLWTKTFGGVGEDWPVQMILLPDGSLLISGYTTSYGTGSGAIWLLKVNSFGDTLYTKTYGGTNESSPCQMLLQPDGSVLILGTVYTDSSSNDIWLLKINSSGDTLWTKTYGGTDIDNPTQMLIEPDGSILILGGTSFGGGSQGVWLIKINLSGQLLWTKTYSEKSLNQPSQMILQPDGSLLILGYTFSEETLGYLILLLKVNSSGTLLWTKTYDGNGDDDALQMLMQPDGSLLILGYIYSNGDIRYKTWLLKTNSSGDTIWTKTYNGVENLNPSVSQMLIQPNGSLLILGSAASYETGDYDIWLASIINDRYAFKDSLFTFKIPVSGDSLSHGYTPLKVPDGMTVSLGGTISWTPKTDSVYMDHVEFHVFDDFGRIDTLTFNIFVNSSYHPVAIKPVSQFIANKNQSFSISQTSSSQIKFTLTTGVSNIDIYDINGRCVQRLKPAGAQVVWNGLSTSGRPVSCGRYFAKIKAGSNSRIVQFSLMR
jgi:hypothetical protein